MADIFGRTATGDGGAFDSALATISIGGISGGVIISNLTANYQRNIQRIYDLASDKGYYVIGRVDGNGSIGCVFGPGKGGGNPYSALTTDVCNGFQISFAMDANCGGASWTRTMTGCRLNSFNITVNAQDMVINENVGFMFASLEVA
jgi:hypothetical protein